MKKKCKKCGEVKLLDEFYNNLSLVDKKESSCKVCRKKGQKLACAKWYAKVKGTQEYKKYNREKHERYRKTNPVYALNHRMKNLIYKVLRHEKQGKTWNEIVGYSHSDLVLHLESHFVKGMTWEKFMKGEIHIDHIIPKSFFEFTSIDDVEFKMCWRLDNLQPLWARDNKVKTNKLSPLRVA